MHFSGPFSLADVTEREWLLANGLGGYASASICGMSTRRYHGLLVAALHPPGGRTLLVAKLDEVVSLAGKDYPLATNQYPGLYHPEGYRWMRTFDLEPDAAVMTFAAGGAELEKRITVEQGENTTHVHYRNIGREAFTLVLAPLVNARDFHGETHEQFEFSVDPGRWLRGPAVHITPWWMTEGYWIFADGGTWQDDRTWYYNMVYIWESRRGLNDLEQHFSPGRLTVTLAPEASCTVSLSTAPPPAPETCPPVPVAVPPLESEPSSDPLEIAQLRRTAESFLVQRRTVGLEQTRHGRTIIAGYHWFGDWGRDTMIALPGLCLLTGRYGDAAEILRTFAAARRRGLLPNLFLDSGEGEAYNTVDASLWFFDAVDRYYRATGDGALVEELRPALEEIVHFYCTGTDYGIHMADDGLIMAGESGWQLTWMDAKVGDWVVTPRMGKPVEINALWYHGLRVMEEFARQFGWSDDYGKLADCVRASFDAFWYADGDYLYDVLEEKSPNAQLRPNQIFAVSLPHSPLDADRAKCVVEAVTRDLLTPCGLRTLSPADPEYRGYYGGNQWERDGAYHQGTVWAWLIGPYVDAYLRVREHSAEAKGHCRALLQPLLEHTRDAGLGSISEIFDGDPPHLPKGTISQAWSVSEVLRAWEACRE